MTETTAHSVHCAANGCPAQASMSRGTTGGAEFWCAYHFSAAPGRIHEVTAELRRLSWLVQLCKGVRHYINTQVWAPEADAAHKEIMLHQRSDLYQQAGTAHKPPETWHQWLRRLEGVLADACKEPKHDAQQPLDV